MTIEELKQAIEAATPGPWGQNPFTPINVQLKSGLTICSMAAATAATEDGFQDELLANARLIVEAVNNLPKLLKVVEAADVAPLYRAGWWMSAALDDPNACAECKQDFLAALQQIETLTKALEDMNDD